jgi:prophage antirepressor-like protein
MTVTNELQVFSNPEFGSVRTLLIDDVPWAVGKDVASALGYKETAKAVRDHVDGEDRGGVQNRHPLRSATGGHHQ